MKRKLIATALLVAMLLSLVACSNSKSTGTPTPTPEPGYGVTLGQYKGIEAVYSETLVTEADVTKSIYLNLKSVAVASTEEDATVKLYDIPNIDYSGSIDGTVFEGGTGTSYDLMLGSNSFIPGFEDAIVGHKVGEEFDIEVTFPENYGVDSLNGKLAVFKIKINSLKVIPELTDEFITANTSFKSYEECRTSVYNTLIEESKATAEDSFKSDVLDKVIANCTFSETLQADADEYAKNLRAQYESYATAYGVTLEVFCYYALGTTLENFEKLLPQAALYNVKLERIYKAIIEAEKFEVTTEEYNNMIETIMTENSIDSAAKVEETYGKENLTQNLLMTKAENFIFDNAVKTEATKTE